MDNNSRAGAVVCKFPDDVETELRVLAAKMGKRRVTRPNGREALVPYAIADAVNVLVGEALAARNSKPGQLPLFAETDGNRVST